MGTKEEAINNHLIEVVRNGGLTFDKRELTILADKLDD